MARKTRVAMQAETREKLLDSARRAFGRKGFAGSSIDEIAEGAGFSRGAFYSNFSSKEDLAVELMGRQMALDMQRIAAMAGAAQGPVETLAKRLREAFPATVTISDWELSRLEMLMLARRNPVFAEKCQALYQPQRERVAEAVRLLFTRAGRLPPASDALLSHLIMSLRLGAALLHEAAGPVPLGEIVELIFRALVALAPPARQDGAPPARQDGAPVGRQDGGSEDRLDATEAA